MSLLWSKYIRNDYRSASKIGSQLFVPNTGKVRFFNIFQTRVFDLNVYSLKTVIDIKKRLSESHESSCVYNCGLDETKSSKNTRNVKFAEIWQLYIGFSSPDLVGDSFI